MAAIIFHGPPGSYKTSSAIWFEMLTALRAGRIVVTNIEGMKPVEEIEKELEEKFPISADIWRLSSQTDTGRELWRRYYHWAPLNAQIIMDEVQDIFPNERTFKPEKYDYKNVTQYEDLIPEKWMHRHLQLLDEVKPKELTSADYDDTDTVLYNEHGHIIYPSTIRESFMRHRKYQWDIVVCTPDITQVHPLIRGACEWGYKHTSKDAIGKVIKYFKRRPRITQHLPKDSATQPKKTDVQFFRKVPEKVHDLYKSTATGNFNASGSGKTPLSSPPVLFACFTFIFCVCYSFYAFFFTESATAQIQQASELGEVTTQVIPAGNQKNTNPAFRNNSGQNASAIIADLELPHRPTAIYITGNELVAHSNNMKEYNYYFKLETASGDYYLSSSDLESYGYHVQRVVDCKVKIITNGVEYPVYCPVPEAKRANPSTNPQTGKPAVNIFGA